MDEIFLMFLMAFLAFAGLFLAWFFMQRAKFKEKIILIEKGIDIKDLHLMENKKHQFSWLKIGIVVIGLSIGLISGLLLMYILRWSDWILPLLGMLLFGGIGMVLANYIDKPSGDK